ncbi:unnamed protein product, partial [Notodromas monacha]
MCQHENEDNMGLPAFMLTCVHMHISTGTVAKLELETRSTTANRSEKGDHTDAVVSGEQLAAALQRESRKQAERRRLWKEQVDKTLLMLQASDDVDTTNGSLTRISSSSSLTKRTAMKNNNKLSVMPWITRACAVQSNSSSSSSISTANIPSSHLEKMPTFAHLTKMQPMRRMENQQQQLHPAPAPDGTIGAAKSHFSQGQHCSAGELLQSTIRYQVIRQSVNSQLGTRRSSSAGWSNRQSVQFLALPIPSPPNCSLATQLLGHPNNW